MKRSVPDKAIVSPAFLKPMEFKLVELFPRIQDSRLYATVFWQTMLLCFSVLLRRVQYSSDTCSWSMAHRSIEVGYGSLDWCCGCNVSDPESLTSAWASDATGLVMGCRTWGGCPTLRPTPHSIRRQLLDGSGRARRIYTLRIVCADVFMDGVHNGVWSDDAVALLGASICDFTLQPTSKLPSITHSAQCTNGAASKVETCP